MTAVAQHDQAGTRDGLRDMKCTFGRDEILDSIKDQSRDIQLFEFAKQIVVT